VTQIGENVRDFDGLDGDEKDICVFLASCGGQFASRAEIARRAGGRRRFEEDPQWVSHALSRLTENGTLESNSSGHYCLRSRPQNGTKPGQPGSEAWNCAGKNILLVDFDGDWRAVAAAFFQEAGGNVVTANYAIDAIVQTSEIRLDLAILDLNRDLESGMELLKFLEVHQPGVRVIQYTRQNQDDDTAMIMRDLCHVQYVRKGHLEALRRAAQTAFQE